ncbi:winged helix-turn-helix transcriptional regulator [Paraflavitalea pollutisoli]|uniref:winged helix-turn-helix transcriptional regulator n=1 Tax=Paraflavitalea pollutisoli TaxID=3034143 RepID=UPI0023EBFC0C|nr:helix-turn-helix domain-containing protein [Paraflavitalea sp. H1-2-19X]
MSYNRQDTVSCENNPTADCTVQAALSIIGGKWKLKIYKALRDGVPQRFNTITKSLGDISEKTLTAQLREMEADGIVVRTVYPEVPPRVEYRLTRLGQSLEAVFASLDTWGKSYIRQKAAVVTD